MLKEIQMCLCIFFVFGFAVFYELSLESSCFFTCKPMSKQFLVPKDVMSQGRSIVFLETSDRLHPPPLVLCSVESAARIYSDRPIVFFLKGLENHTVMDLKPSSPALFSLSAMRNVFLFPLQLNFLFQDTPLLQWYLQVRGKKRVGFWWGERLWKHVFPINLANVDLPENRLKDRYCTC